MKAEEKFQILDKPYLDIPNEEVKEIVIGFSDIHGNLEALQSFLQVLVQLRIAYPKATPHLFGLGDYVDYGPDSVEVLKQLNALLEKETIPMVLIPGNHDVMIFELTSDVFGPNMINNQVSRHFKRLKGTRGRISAMLVADQINKDQEAYRILNRICVLGTKYHVHSLSRYGIGITCVHGSLVQDNLWGSAMDDNSLDFILQFHPEETNNIVLCGHTHIPGIKMKDNNMIVNVGSIGQPRDGNPLGSFAVLYVTEDKTYVQIQRFTYDCKSTIDKIKFMLPQQHPYYGERLLSGK